MSTTAPSGLPPSSPQPEISLPAGYTLQQLTTNLAQGVLAAYTAYNNGSNNAIVLAGYKSFTPIYVLESTPNTPIAGFSSALATDALATASAAVDKAVVDTADQSAYSPRGALAAYAPLPDATCTPTPATGTPSAGNQLFGFSAVANDSSHNIVVLRGTVTIEEASYDMTGWGTNTPCLLPSYPSYMSSPGPQQAYGNVNSSLYSFYTGLSWAEMELGYVTLGDSFKAAVAALAQANPGKPWYVAAHSLGGPMATLGALDASVSQSYGTTGPQPVLFTFGGLHLGDASFVAKYAAQLPIGLRFANLCDFVPSLVSLEPVVLNPPYKHVGLPATFIWQTWDDWGNHSMQCIYLATVQNHWDCICFERTPPQYPQRPPCGTPPQ